MPERFAIKFRSFIMLSEREYFINLSHQYYQNYRLSNYIVLLTF
jgi:hypothetical protein